MKLLGILLVVASGLGAGLWSAVRLRRRADLLLELKVLLQSLQTGIRYSSQSLSELILDRLEFRLCKGAEHSELFLWDPVKALEQAGRDLLEDPGDWAWFQGFTQGLGVSDTQGQLDHIALYQSLLEPRLAQAREEARQKTRVRVALGLFAGVSLGLLLW